MTLGALLGAMPATASGVTLVGAAYALHLVLDDPPLDARAAVVAAGLLLAAELASWSGELRREVSREPGRQLRRLGLELSLCLGGMLLSALVLAAADLGRIRGIAIEAAGAAAATVLLWLVLDALRRPREADPTAG